MVGLGERRGDYVPGAATEQEAEETLSCFVEVAGKCQTLFERGFGGPKGYRMLSHADSRLAVRLIIMDRWLTSVILPG